MKRFKMPKIEETASDYKLWGLSIPKIQNSHLPQIIKREKTRKKPVPDREDLISQKALSNFAKIDGDEGLCTEDVKDDNEKVVEEELKLDEKEVIGKMFEEQNEFTDIVFSFFSSTDQKYIVHGDEYVDVGCLSENNGLKSSEVDEFKVKNNGLKSRDEDATVYTLNKDGLKLSGEDKVGFKVENSGIKLSDEYVEVKSTRKSKSRDDFLSGCNNDGLQTNSQYVDAGLKIKNTGCKTSAEHASVVSTATNVGCKSSGVYEIMNGSNEGVGKKVQSEMSVYENGACSQKIHKSEVKFYVNATCLKGDGAVVMESEETSYDLPKKLVRKDSLKRAKYTVQNKSLNDISVEQENENKYQNSASLDNLSQVCNFSLKNSESKISITSLPELDSLNKTKNFVQNPFVFPSITNSVTKSSMRSEYSNYFDGKQKAQKIKNRLSALYAARKGFKGKKRLSKAWYGIKEWFEMEKIKMDNVVSKKMNRKQVGRSSGDEYPESEFSEYEDVLDGNASLDSFSRDEDFRAESVLSDVSESVKRLNLSDETKLKRKEVRSLSVNNSNAKLDHDDQNLYVNNEKCGTLRQSRSQPSVLMIGEPILVKINCDDVSGQNGQCFVDQDGDRDQLLVGDMSPDCNSNKSDCFSGDMQNAGIQRNEQDKFAELRTIVKEGTVMCKELLNILQQRAEVERQYCSGILRVGARARRAAKGVSGAALASKRTALDMETRAQIHRQFSNRLVEEVVRPLQRLVSNRDSVRKLVESDVGRTARRLEELRSCEERTKKASHAAARFNERLQDTSVGRGSSPSQEVELRRKKTKSDEAASKADVEYYMACVRAEKARVEWETSVAKGLDALVELEEERLAETKRAIKRYISLASQLGPGAPLEEVCQVEAGMEAALAGELLVSRDMVRPAAPAMRLPDPYCQHNTLAMNRERRRQALLRILQLIKGDMERERKSKQALEKLATTISSTPSLGGHESQQNVQEKMYHIRSLLTYLEGARVQASAALGALSGRPRAPHPLLAHVRVERDRRGLQRTTLTVPTWLQHSYSACGSSRAPSTVPSPPPTPMATLAAMHSTWSDRGAADGVSIQHYSDIEESVSEDHARTPPVRPPLPHLPSPGEHFDNTPLVHAT